MARPKKETPAPEPKKATIAVPEDLKEAQGEWKKEQDEIKKKGEEEQAKIQAKAKADEEAKIHKKLTDKPKIISFVTAHPNGTVCYGLGEDGEIYKWQINNPFWEPVIPRETRETLAKDHEERVKQGMIKA